MKVRCNLNDEFWGFPLITTIFKGKRPFVTLTHGWDNIKTNLKAQEQEEYGMDWFGSGYR
jgi:hypothetical protein